MKPPPRKRSKPELSTPPTKMYFLFGNRRVDSVFPGQIQSEVDSLKDKVISSASFEFERRRRQERKVKKPIELWTDMASSVTGSLEETINTAFAQVTTNSISSGGLDCFFMSLHIIKQQISSPPSSAPSPAASPSISSLISTLATKPTPPPPSSPAAALPAGLGRSCMLKEDSPRIIGVKCVVDFERLYRYLSVILKPDEECHLTPMEGAIMLDLLMSLPEELPQLDCKELQKHLKQVNLRDRVVKAADSQSSESSNATSQQDADVPGVCPPLNPFMVPVKLLKCRKVPLQTAST
uniref:snRNA-activating protein complex subunit 2 n=1 Tax=Labrus bergylta TaxID=56723 RepID=A0A3Q3F070_9LABR